MLRLDAWKAMQRREGVLYDTYRFRVYPSTRRHSKCRCTVPCVARFGCESPVHVGRRATPWCNGASDNYPDFCDDCWCILTPDLSVQEMGMMFQNGRMKHGVRRASR